jgi:hypothetical protein
MGMDLQLGHGHTAWTWTCSIDMKVNMLHRLGHVHTTSCFHIDIEMDIDIYIGFDKYMVDMDVKVVK